MVVLVVPHITCFTLLESDDARIWNLLDVGIADEDFLSVGDPLSGRDVMPEVSVDLQPPEHEFKVTVKNIPVDTITESDKKMPQPRKPIKLSLDNTQISTHLEPPTKPFGINVKTVATRPSTGALPRSEQQKSSVGDVLMVADEGVTSTGRTTVLGWNPELRLPRLPAPVVKVPLRFFQVKKQKLLGSKVKMAAKSSWKNKKIQKPDQDLKPPTKDFEVKPQEVRRMLTAAVPLPSRQLLPPTRQFLGPPTQEMLPPTREFMPLTRELTPPIREFARPQARKILPPTREFFPLARELTPPVHELAILGAGGRAPVPLTPPGRQFVVSLKPEVEQRSFSV